MTDEKDFKIEVDGEFVKNLFALTNKTVDLDEVTLEDMKKFIFQLDVNFKNDLIQTITKPKDDAEGSIEHLKLNQDETKTILIVDDLGVITFQLAVIFQKFGYETVTSKEITDAISKFKKQKFDIIIMDLYIPTEREGFILLDEFLKIIQHQNLSTKIGIMSATSKKEQKQYCISKGAKFVVEKKDNWQRELINLCREL